MRRLWMPLFWIAYAGLSGFQIWISMLDHGHWPPRIFFHELCIWSGWMALTPIVFRLARHFPLAPPRARNILLHVGVAFVFAVLHGTYWTMLTVIVRPYDAMGISRFTPFPLFARLPGELVIYFAAAAAGHAITVSRRNAELERSLNAARLHALELQIQPHFLFNTLNAISSLVRARQNNEAVEVIAGLSDLLRYTLDHAGEQRVPLEQETAMLERYLGIQRVRFADRLDVNIDVDDDVRRAAVPTLILQPLAENAIRHGIARVATAGRVELRAFRSDGALRIEMFNTGSLLSDRKRGIGLRNTEERLQQLYGAAHDFELKESRGGVLASMSIPWSEVA